MDDVKGGELTFAALVDDKRFAANTACGLRRPTNANDPEFAQLPVGRVEIGRLHRLDQPAISKSKKGYPRQASIRHHTEPSVLKASGHLSSAYGCDKSWNMENNQL